MREETDPPAGAGVGEIMTQAEREEMEDWEREADLCEEVAELLSRAAKGIGENAGRIAKREKGRSKGKVYGGRKVVYE